jgi:hypothetical protein
MKYKNASGQRVRHDTFNGGKLFQVTRKLLKEVGIASLCTKP